MRAAQKNRDIDLQFHDLNNALLTACKQFIRQKVRKNLFYDRVEDTRFIRFLEILTFRQSTMSMHPIGGLYLVSNVWKNYKKS